MGAQSGFVLEGRGCELNLICLKPRPLSSGTAAEFCLLSLHQNRNGHCALRLSMIYCSFAAIVVMNGTVAERLGSGLQNRVHRFDSGRYLFTDRGCCNLDLLAHTIYNFVCGFWGMAKW